MVRIALLVAAGLFAAPLLAQEEVYIYVSYKDAAGVSSRHKLECLDAGCEVTVKGQKRAVTLSDEQRQGLRDALQAEAKQFVVAADSVSREKSFKLKFRYNVPRKRLEIEQRFPADEPGKLTPEMLEVIKTHLELDLSSPLVPPAEAGEGKGSEPEAQGKDE